MLRARFNLGQTGSISQFHPFAQKGITHRHPPLAPAPLPFRVLYTPFADD